MEDKKQEEERKRESEANLQKWYFLDVIFTD